MKCFVAKCVNQCIVVELDWRRRAGAAVDNTGGLAQPPHAPARGATFGGTRERGEFDGSHECSAAVSAAFAKRKCAGATRCPLELKRKLFCDNRRTSTPAGKPR